MNTLLKLTLSTLLFFSLCFATGCEKSPSEEAEDAAEEAADAVEQAADNVEDAAN
ncbi:MAG TPA: hypothetical protein VJ952_13355 [Opitutales bacterium]|nr:hypothetical protein [Opitutales bacterium]